MRLALLALLLALAAPLRAEEIPASGGNFGGTGLLEMRNARLREDGTLEVGAAWRRQRDFWFLNIQALPFLETTFRLANRLNGTTGHGTTVDRAFDAKLRLWRESQWLPAFAVGLQDAVGTGIYGGEYLVASKRLGPVDVTLGLGWGRLGTGADLPNIGLLGNRGRSVGQGGTPSLGSWFRGRDVAVFGGAEYHLPPLWGLEGLRAKLEYSGDALRDERGGWPARTTGLRGRAATRWNAGLHWQGEHVDVGAQFLHGTDALLRLSLRLDAHHPPSLPAEVLPPLPPRQAPLPAPAEAHDAGRAAAGDCPPAAPASACPGAALPAGPAVPAGSAALPAEPGPTAVALTALRRAGFRPLAFVLQGAEARVLVSGGRFRRLSQVAGRVLRALQPVLPPAIETLRVEWQRQGVTTARLVVLRQAFETPQASAEEVLASAHLLPAEDPPWPLRTKQPAPWLDWGIAPRLPVQLGDPRTAARWQLAVAAGGRVGLGAGFAIAGTLSQAVAGNLGGGLPSNSLLPHVRSDVGRYARAGSTSIPALYAERIWTPAEDVFARITGGLLEPMFAGIATEALWRPATRGFALGLDLSWVQQRDYGQKLSLRRYQVTTGHLSAYAELPWFGLFGVLRGGRYLAGDWGTTIELGRRFDNGIEIGGFASFTTAGFHRFGEGSFDKGIYLRIPLEIFGPETTATAGTTLRPVVRDGGQRLAVDNPLWEVAREGRAEALGRGYLGFLRKLRTVAGGGTARAPAGLLAVTAGAGHTPPRMQLQALAQHLAFALLLAGVSALAVRAMIRWPILDDPSRRAATAHTRPTPKGGGVGVVLAFVLGMLVLYAQANFARVAGPQFLGVILAAVAIAGVALADDIMDFRFVVKLGAQAGAACVALGSGLILQRLSIPWVGDLNLAWAAPLVTLFWIVGCTNAVNFMDGLDSLVAGTLLIACIALAVISAGQGGWFVYAASLFLAAGFLGFLPFNWHPARIFMGDVGSQFAGFMLAVLAVAAARFDAMQVSFLIVPLLIFGLLYDACFTLARRAFMGEGLATPHRTHLYQMAQRSGMPVRGVALAHWGFTCFHADLAAIFVQLPAQWKPFVVLPALAVQLAWTLYVLRRMRRAGMGWKS